MEQPIRHALQAAITAVFSIEDVQVELTPTEEQFGDYATNCALKLAKQLQMSPRAIAEQLAVHIAEQSIDSIANVQVAGPGFINITLTDSALIAAMYTRPEKSLAGKKILVEYSDPNPLKPLHAGHLYTTLVGDTIARLVERAGAQTIRINYGGDVGLHVAKSMWAILRELGGEHPDKLTEIPEAGRAEWLGERYVAGNNAYEDDENAKHEIVAVNKQVYALHESGETDSDFAKIYYTVRQWSYDYFEDLYRQLQVAPFDRYIPESEVTPLGVQTVREQQSNGVFAESDGAVVFNGESKGLHTRVFINSAGLPTYETKDVGLSLTKWRDYQFDESIIITANEQTQYMQVVIAAIGSFAAEPAARTKHLTHGVVKLQGGVKMSSRKGNTVTAQDIINSAQAAAVHNNPDASNQTVLAAIKYAFAKNRIGGDIVYNPADSIALEGNSGPYLQYAHARAQSILRKADTASEFTHEAQLQADERTLVRAIGGYAQAVSVATLERMPHHICTYLYELAQTFNRFYEKNRVIGDERQQLRIALVTAYAETLADGLTLLGISAPDEM